MQEFSEFDISIQVVLSVQGKSIDKEKPGNMLKQYNHPVIKREFCYGIRSALHDSVLGVVDENVRFHMIRCTTMTQQVESLVQRY